MLYKNTLLFLFLILISSLASSQWSSDQLLFSRKSKGPRPKPNNAAETTNHKEAELPFLQQNQEPAAPLVNTSDVNSVEPVIQNQETTTPIKRAPASITLSKEPAEALSLYLGGLSIKSQSDNQDLSFNEQGLTFGAKITIPFLKTNKVDLSYFSSNEMATRTRNKVKWDDFQFQSLWSVELLKNNYYLGLSLRQSSLWQSIRINESSMQPLNSYGLLGVVPIPSFLSEKTQSEFRLQYSPVMKNNRSTINGDSIVFQWDFKYDLSLGRAYLLDVGYERISLKSRSDEMKNLSQEHLNFYIGYQVYLPNKSK